MSSYLEVIFIYDIQPSDLTTGHIEHPNVSLILMYGLSSHLFKFENSHSLPPNLSLHTPPLPPKCMVTEKLQYQKRML